MFKVGQRVFWDGNRNTVFNKELYKGTIVRIVADSYITIFDNFERLGEFNYPSTELVTLGKTNPNSGIIIKE